MTDHQLQNISIFLQKRQKRQKIKPQKKRQQSKIGTRELQPHQRVLLQKKDNSAKVEQGTFSSFCWKKKEKETSGVEPGTLSFRSNVYKQTNKHCLFLHSNRLTSTIQKSIGR